jgi:hypothetical protein
MGTAFAAGRLQPVLTNDSPSHHESTDKYVTESRQKWPPHLLFGYVFPGEEQVGASHISIAMQRRNSAPSFTAESTSNVTMERRQSLVMESSRLERESVVDPTHSDELAAETSPPTLHLSIPAPVEDSSIAQDPSPVQCSICLEEIPGTESSTQISGAIQPCMGCSGSFCRACIKAMFIGATKDISRMPPRCCQQIHLHHARADMTDAEVAEYKSKYDEWSTPRPFYCPVPTCSVFIPNRLLPHHPARGDAAEKRADSGTGTPSLPNFPCPACAGQICLECRQVAHPDTTCAALDAGIDPQLVAALKKWGFGRCPKCGHGVKRMYGCSRMECRCGAQFCWNCKQSWYDCGNACEDTYSDSDDDAYVSDEEDNDDNDDNDEADNERADERAADSHADATEPNLDSRAALAWRDLELGREPTSDVMDQAWACEHSFRPLSLPLDEAAARRLALDMECVACWRDIHPAPAKAGDDDDDDDDGSAGHAFECGDCALLVCTGCKDGMGARQWEKEKEKGEAEGGQDAGEGGGDE